MAGEVLSGDELAAWVARSCERSGVPLKVTDPRMVERVAVLLGSVTGSTRACSPELGADLCDLP